VAGERAGEVRAPASVEGMRRLRVYPGVCRRVPGGIAQRAWGHECADMPQAELRSRGYRAGASSGQRGLIQEMTMKIQIIKKAVASSKKKSMACDMMIDEAPMHQK
jgi:hypothetical protein